MTRDDLRYWLGEVAAHPASYGFAAAVARWMLGDRAGGLRGLLGYLTAALVVAWGGALYLAGEGVTPERGGFYLLLLCFVAKDLLTALAGLAVQFRADPLGVLWRIRQALRGGPPPDDTPTDGGAR